MSQSPSAQVESEQKAARDKRDRSVTHFWRALRYLAPHRRLVVISIGCAFLVGLTFTGGLSTMLPVLKVLLNGESVQVWSGRLVAEQRMEFKLAESPDKVLIVSAHHKGAAGRAGLREGDQLTAPGAEGNAEHREIVRENRALVRGRPPLPRLVRAAFDFDGRAARASTEWRVHSGAYAVDARKRGEPASGFFVVCESSRIVAIERPRLRDFDRDEMLRREARVDSAQPCEASR